MVLVIVVCVLANWHIHDIASAFTFRWRGIDNTLDSKHLTTNNKVHITDGFFLEHVLYLGTKEASGLRTRPSETPFFLKLELSNPSLWYHRISASLVPSMLMHPMQIPPQMHPTQTPITPSPAGNASKQKSSPSLPPQSLENRPATTAHVEEFLHAWIRSVIDDPFNTQNYFAILRTQKEAFLSRSGKKTPTKRWRWGGRGWKGKEEMVGIEQNRTEHTMPVSAERCCDWKKTASGSRQLGHSLFDRGSWMVWESVSAKVYSSLIKQEGKKKRGGEFCALCRCREERNWNARREGSLLAPIRLLLQLPRWDFVVSWWSTCVVLDSSSVCLVPRRSNNERHIPNPLALSPSPPPPPPPPPPPTDRNAAKA